MKLNRTSIKNPADWVGYRLPAFDVDAMVKRTREEPIWLHMGAGNIFRIFPAVLQQDLLEKGLSDRGICACELYDEEIIPRTLTPYDNLSLAVTLKTDGTADKQIVASIAESISDKERMLQIFRAPSLQMVTFTITEKGYGRPLMKEIADGLAARHEAGAFPLSLVSMDNCPQNGDVLKSAILSEANANLHGYINSLAFPWTMIDKITPRPSQEVAEMLAKDGYEDTGIITTSKGIWVAASYVIAEECQYLVIEDDFPNGRPPLEKVGVYFTDRETVNKAEKMKVGTCLNPLHTALGTAGCLLGHETVAGIMQDRRIADFIKYIAEKESMPVVADPKIINPQEFLRDCLERRFPNTAIKDTPQRLVEDNSKKIPIRFGETIKLRREAGLPEEELEAIPLFFAIYARYLMGKDDNWQKMNVEPDPRREELMAYFKEEPYNLKALFSDASLFGVDLYSGPMGKKAEGYFAKLIEGPGSVAKTLADFCDCI